MTNSPEPAGRASDFTLVDVLNVLLSNWRLLVLLPLIGALAFGTLSLLTPRRYVAVASFVPHGANAGRLGGASIIAQQLGMNVPTGRPGQSPEFYQDLLNTTPILRSAVEEDYRFTGSNGFERQMNLIQYYEISASDSPEPAWRLAVEELRSSLTTSVTRETGIVRIHVTMLEPMLAEQVAGQLLESVNAFNLQAQRQRAEQESQFIADRLREARAALMVAEDSLQRFLQQNRVFTSSPELSFTYERLQRSVARHQELYNALSQSYQQARIDAVRNTPVLMPIEEHVGSARLESRRTLLKASLGFVLGMLLALVYSVLTIVVRRGLSVGDPAYLELQRRTQELRRELAAPLASDGERS